MNQTSRTGKFNVIGLIVTLIVTAAFVWTMVQLYYPAISSPATAAQQAQSNEQRTFTDLQLIEDAQSKYKQTDWQKSGHNTFAGFTIHLWKSVTAAGEPFCVDLIPERLAFAMEPAKAVDGYYHIDMHERLLPDKTTTRQLDYEKEWAIMAMPLPSSQGVDRLYFLADASGIYVRSAKYIAPSYPDNLAAEGWTKIRDAQELLDYQKKIPQPRK